MIIATSILERGIIYQKSFSDKQEAIKYNKKDFFEYMAEEEIEGFTKDGVLPGYGFEVKDGVLSNATCNFEFNLETGDGWANISGNNADWYVMEVS